MEKSILSNPIHLSKQSTDYSTQNQAKLVKINPTELLILQLPNQVLNFFHKPAKIIGRSIL